MKLEYLENIESGYRYPEDNIIRLYDFDISEAKKLQQVIAIDLIANKKDIEVDKLDFIYPINCKLTLKIANEDIAIKRKELPGNEFVCELTTREFEKMINLIEPFCKSLIGYQWLLDLYCETDLLLSPNGKW